MLNFLSHLRQIGPPGQARWVDLLFLPPAQSNGRFETPGYFLGAVAVALVFYKIFFSGMSHFFIYFQTAVRLTPIRRPTSALFQSH